MESYRVTYGGGVVQRNAPATDASSMGTLPPNTIFQAKGTKEVGDVTFAEMVTGNWVAIKKAGLVTCVPVIRKFKVLYGGGAVVREEPKLTSPATGAKQAPNSVFEASNAALEIEGANTFVNLKTGGWVVQKLGDQVICLDITAGDPSANAQQPTSSRGAARTPARSTAGVRVVDGALAGGLRDKPSFPTGQETEVIAAPELCSDVALIGLKYNPPNSVFQISKTGHFITYRKGIWNRHAPVSNSTSERSESSVKGSFNSSIVYSVEGIPLRLTDAAIAKINHAYTGEPLLVTMKLNQDCCHFEFVCGGLSCCSNHAAYSDDTVDVRGIWFGEKDAVPEPTILSDAGCLCVLPLNLQHALKHLYIRPPMNNPCNPGCCQGPPLINHVAIDAYEVQMVTDRQLHARIYSSLSDAEASSSLVSGRTTSTAPNAPGTSGINNGTTNPMVMQR